MKNGKRPTLKEKKLISEKGLNVENWLVVKHTSELMEIMHKHTGKTRIMKLG